MVNVEFSAPNICADERKLRLLWGDKEGTNTEFY